ncbi:hypothetical protein TNIN_401531 [Trichonephila inaurata madagascariensis]|uniref:Uncharacterized protein n=1 Tax=Trichonephila inaurata madagascariensis TaxID=2747483 RepID=A0A8X7CQC0_9ARAC|nr:hypothetical protein TNIN_401531 [Trichonephila inaurata madagascariensis]
MSALTKALYNISQPFSSNEGRRRVGQQLNETSSHHALLSVNHRSREARDSCRLLKYPGNRNFSRLPDNCVSRTTALNNATASVRCLLTRGIHRTDCSAAFRPENQQGIKYFCDHLHSENGLQTACEGFT